MKDVLWIIFRHVLLATKDAEAAALFCHLLERRTENEFTYGAQILEQELCLTKCARLRVTSILVKKGLLTVKKRGLPARNFYAVNEGALLKSHGKSVQELFDAVKAIKERNREIRREVYYGSKDLVIAVDALKQLKKEVRDVQSKTRN